MKTLITSLALLFITVMSWAQEDKKFQYVEVEAGVTIPLSQLKNTMNIAPNVGIWIRKEINKNNNWAFGASVNFPKMSAFQYANENYNTRTKSFSGMVGMKLDKTILHSSEREVALIWSSSFGYGFYFYDDVKARQEYEEWPDWKKDKEEKPIFSKPFSTIHIGQGLMFRIKDFGLHARYNYSPYSLFSKRITKEFGAQSISIGLFYRQ